MSPAAALRRASELIGDGRLDEAEAAIRGLLRGRPDDVDALELLGSLCLRQERLEAAVEACAAALRLDPDRRDPYRTLARAQWLLGRPHEAAQVLMTAVARRPADGDLQLEAAVTLREAGLEDQALALLEATASRCHESRWEAEHLRLELLLAGGRYAEARDAALVLLASAPDDIAAHDRLAVACYHLDDLPAALRATEALVCRTPLLVENQLRLASLLRETGELARAAALWEHIAAEADDLDHCQTAAESLRALDEAQLPSLLAMAEDSDQVRRELLTDPPAAAARYGFRLSQPGLARLVANLRDAGPPEPRQ